MGAGPAPKGEMNLEAIRGLGRQATAPRIRREDVFGSTKPAKHARNRHEDSSEPLRRPNRTLGIRPVPYSHPFA